MSWADSAADGATGGSGGYGGGRDRGGGGRSSRDRSGYDSGFGAEIDTGGLEAPESSARGAASGGSKTSARDDRPSAYSGMFGRELDPHGSVSVTSGTISGDMASLAEEAERSFMDRVRTRREGLTVDPGLEDARAREVAERLDTISEHTGMGLNDVEDGALNDMMNGSRSQMDSATHDLTQRASRPHGLLSTVQDIGFGLLGPVGIIGDMALDSFTSGQRAAETLSALNDRFGTSFDDGFSSNLGRHATASITGGIMSAGLGRIGAQAGLGLAGMPGAYSGAMAGSQMGSKVGDLALDTLAPGPQANAEQTVASVTPGPPTNGGSRNGRAPRGLLERGVNRQAATANHGPADFDGYASYAESFFT